MSGECERWPREKQSQLAGRRLEGAGGRLQATGGIVRNKANLPGQAGGGAATLREIKQSQFGAGFVCETKPICRLANGGHGPPYWKGQLCKTKPICV